MITECRFICPGAQKAGTTTLHDLLSRHPDIRMPEIKESKYFLGSATELSVADYDRRYFGRPGNARVHGEVDPEYMIYPDVPRKIRSILGDSVRFLFILRNPVDRAYSHYWMSYRRGFETEGFEAAFELEKERIETGGQTAMWHHNYFQRGLYSEQIERFLGYFPMENMRFFTFESFVSDRGRIMGEILAFLGLDDSFRFENLDRKSNVGGLPRYEWLSALHGGPMAIKRIAKVLIPSKRLRWSIYPVLEKINRTNRKPPSMSPETRKMLTDYYADDLHRTEKIIGRDLSAWGM